jgi:crotonobetainyl-CoA:carnitine CoA-transferase CaiB-like acyl-CoA transferase
LQGLFRELPGGNWHHLGRLSLSQTQSELAEVRAWLATFDSLEQLQAQVSEAGLAVGRVRTVNEFAKSDWVREWNAVVQVDDRGGGTLRMPGNPWIFSRSELPPPGAPAFQGEHNEDILKELQIPKDKDRGSATAEHCSQSALSDPHAYERGAKQ